MEARRALYGRRTSTPAVNELSDHAGFDKAAHQRNPDAARRRLPLECLGFSLERCVSCNSVQHLVRPWPALRARDLLTLWTSAVRKHCFFSPSQFATLRVFNSSFLLLLRAFGRGSYGAPSNVCLLRSPAATRHQPIAGQLWGACQLPSDVVPVIHILAFRASTNSPDSVAVPRWPCRSLPVLLRILATVCTAATRACCPRSLERFLVRDIRRLSSQGPCNLVQVQTTINFAVTSRDSLRRRNLAASHCTVYTD